jgi:hypothetical protein
MSPLLKSALRRQLVEDEGQDDLDSVDLAVMADVRERLARSRSSIRKLSASAA